ncbi:hypothetical protein [Xanthomonas campestris]|uniref:hypothetical protein n=1 Tax=Xanthomonas campestris TaxID=339 RepID=UPI002B231F83|nr:hypothetical protein [Xanthomonas campestris]MEA9762033.1 hypothetical protein [Xanthomonas campestris pv. raphani]MEA9814637.1 hypothetical protein [Xanthomonas campestris pv. raphani]MEA9907770.1 hypothetical protein [Xanthomonas campestris pv. raphani]MEA9924295.1 hypothetical protein [Xanthomonas campestris pv. raphani]MEA9936031.1 hypothetical protein [Xanthomonas campestris pv. raphani]
MSKETQSVRPDAGSGGDALADAARRVLCEIDSGDFDGEVSQAAYAALRAALAARPPAQGGTVTGWRMIDGVTVFDVASHSGIVEPQQFVRHADYLAARQSVGMEPVAPQSIPEGWALVDLSTYAVLPQLPSEQMIGAGWPAGEMISECFDSLGAYADLIASHSANGSGLVHGKGQPAPAPADGEIAAWRKLADHVRTGVPVYPGRYTDIRTHDVASFIRVHQGMPEPAAVPAPDLSRTIAQLNRMRIVLRNARAYVENFTCKSALPTIQQKMIGQIDEVLGALAHAWPKAVPGEGPLSGKYGAVLRPFVAMMERELHANAGKGDRPGWLSMDSSTALLEIYHHMGKLQRATKNADEPGIAEYAADVANMAMMLVDVCGLLPVDSAAPLQPAAAKEHAHWPQIKLWFFRELNAAQRAKLFTLCGLGCDGESMANHSAETMVLRAIIDQQAKPEVQ